jgi:hypothetical protein
VQNARFLRENFAHLILDDIDSNESLKSYLNVLEQKLAEGTTNPGHAVDLLFKKYKEFLLT